MTTPSRCGMARTHPLGVQIIELMHPDAHIFPASVHRVPHDDVDGAGMYVAFMVTILGDDSFGFQMSWLINMSREMEILRATDVCQALAVRKVGGSLEAGFNVSPTLQ